MQASPLQLESSAITRLNIEANTAYQATEDSVRFSDFAGAGLASSVECEALAGTDRRYAVRLSVRIPGTDAVQPPYTLNLEVIGIFQCEGSNPSRDEQLASINGPAVLYGSIRELVMQITSRGPFPPVVLPSVNFIPPDQSVAEDGRMQTPPSLP
jgi:hypothetical protein